MTDPELKLAELWDEDEPPARDPAFVIAVMEQVERRRLALAGAWLAIMTAVCALMAWALAPVARGIVEPLVQAGPSLGALAGAAALAVALWSWLSARPQSVTA